jgi:hypothetical protein
MIHHAKRVLGLSSLTSAFAIFAGPFGDVDNGAVDYRQSSLKAKVPCKTLVQQTNTDFSVISSISIDGVCRVSGVIPGEIRFEVNLPDNWNGRMMMTGNGGLGGQAPESAGPQQQRDSILNFGFATAYTDTGHDNRVEPGGSFAQNNLAKLVDYGYRAVHLTAVTAKTLISHYYKRAPSYSYFVGCSNGGRQALMAAQRFPQDFDGILAGAPANDFTGLKFSQAHRMKALSSSPISPEKVYLLGKHIYEKCDAVDGLKDGLINDPRRCDFNPEEDLPNCLTAETTNCFTPEEQAALSMFYSPVTLAGKEVYPAFPVGSEGVGPSYGGQMLPGWIPWVVAPEGQPILDRLGSEFFRYIVFVEDKPDYNWIEFDFQAAPDNLNQASYILNATDPDLSEFRNNGGKLISYFGWADPDINPLTAISYQQAVDDKVAGDVNDFYRLFMVPGMFHCTGGPGPFDFDAITPLIDWVEKKYAPDVIIGRNLVGDAVKFERPLCPVPMQAKYLGLGELNKASSFECQ